MVSEVCTFALERGMAAVAWALIVILKDDWDWRVLEVQHRIISITKLHETG